MEMTEEMVQPSSDSFWELGKYMRTVKRCENGYKLCDQMRSMVEERSKIEKNYAKSLIGWSQNWSKFLDNGPEYGTIQSAWRGLLLEADTLAELHTEMGDRLISEVQQSVRQWQKENYHKSMMHFKEVKEFEDGFRKAQKPWGKRYTKVVSARKEYHNACRQEKSTSNQENNARGDATISADQLKKLQEKLRKLQNEVEACREKYQAALGDLNQYNAKYHEDMTEVFDKTQDFDKKRIEFFKKILFQVHQVLDLSLEDSYAKIYKDLHSTITQTNADKDLDWWSCTNGVKMAMNWPQFEEYSPELQAISKRGKSQLGSTSDGITITSIRHHHQRESSYGSYTGPAGEPSPPSSQRPASMYTAPTTTGTAPTTASRSAASTASKTMRGESYDSSLNPFWSDEDEDGRRASVSEVESTPQTAEGESEIKEEKAETVQATCSVPAPVVTNGQSGMDNGSNPFGYDTAESEEERSLEGDSNAGWAVRALYDYDEAEDDEISFKAGDVFVQLENADEMGWCKGRKGGKEGLFPANYVEKL